GDVEGQRLLNQRRKTEQERRETGAGRKTGAGRETGVGRRAGGGAGVAGAGGDGAVRVGRVGVVRPTGSSPPPPVSAVDFDILAAVGRSDASSVSEAGSLFSEPAS